jgi:hypothetical protein
MANKVARNRVRKVDREQGIAGQLLAQFGHNRH